MSGYPPASSYGPPPGLTTLNGSYQPQHGNNNQPQQQQYPQYDSNQYDYSNYQNDPNASAVNHNASYQGAFQNAPPFSAAAVASGVPPLPIYPPWPIEHNPSAYNQSFWGPPQPPQPQHPQHPQQYQPPVEQQQQQYHHQDHHQPQSFAPYDPFNATIHLNASGPSPMSFAPQPILHAQSQPLSQPQPPMFAPPTGPRARQPAEEGELSEGEYVPSPKRLPPRVRERENRQNKKNPPNAPKDVAIARKEKDHGASNYKGHNIAQDFDHYSPPAHFDRPSTSRQSSDSSQGRDNEANLGGGPSKHRRKGASARREARSIAIQKETPPGSKRPSVSGPVVKQLPLPPPPTVVPRAVQAAREQAQNAVLNLHGLKVRLDDYIEEGIDEKVIKDVFADVGLEPTRVPTIVERNSVSKPAAQMQQPVLPGLSAVAPKSTIPEKPATVGPPKDKADKPSGLGNRKPSTAAAAAPGNKAEERKDRIARLLADKNKQAAKPADLPIESAVSSTAPLPLPATLPHPPPMQHPLPPKPKPQEASAAEVAAPDVVVAAAAPKIDKDALLRQKMEALQQKQAEDRDAVLRKKMQEMEVSKSQQKPDKDALLRQKMEALNESRRKRELETRAAQSADEPMNGPPESQGFQTMAFFNPLAQFHSAFAPMPPNGAPAIPGLFLGGQPALPSPPVAVAPPPAPINTRKRPVASDFDSAASTPPTFKKPFGHVQQDSVFIDVSDDSEDDDEDDDEDDMVLDEPADKFGRDAKTWPKPHMRDLPPLSDFPPKRAYTAPNSTVSTPPVSQTFSRPPARPEDLKRKEFAIQEMRRKIAEAEERKKAKLAAAGSSNSTSKTPTPPMLSHEPSASADRIETSNQIERLMSDTSRKIEEDQQKLAETQMLKEQKTRDLKKAQEEQRRKRQAELAANLPAVDADVRDTQRRLAEMRAEMQRLEADMEKKLDDKRLLAAEMEKLNVEADEHLEAQKEQLKEINDDIAIVDHVAAVTVSESADTGPSASSADVPADSVIQASTTPSSQNPSYATQATRPVQPRIANNQVAPPSVALVKEGIHDDVAEASSPLDMTGKDPLRATEKRKMPTKSIESTEKGHEICSGSESTPMIESSGSSRSSESHDRGVSLRSSSNPSDQSMDESSSAEMEIDETPSQIARLPARTEETGSSESSSEELSDSSGDNTDSDDGTEEQAGAGITTEDAEMPDVSDTSSDESSSDSESEDYEPADATQRTIEGATAIRSPPNSVAPASGKTDATSSERNAAQSYSTERQAQLPPAGASNAEATNGHTTKKHRFFTPYDSPLKQFHAYRLHPQFTKEVPGGYTSLTYSNRIEDKKEFCRFELAGGVCNDPKCDFQHFREIQLPDSDILVVLLNPKGLAKDEKKRFNEDLTQELSKMKAQNVYSFDKVATNIAGFRHKFFGNDGKVFLLDGSPDR